MEITKLAIPVLAAFSLWSEAAPIHIKWFMDFDITESPRQLTQVLN